MPYIHHVVIHFPVALGFLSALCAMLAWRRPHDWVDVSRWLSYLVALAAAVAITSGLLSASHVIEEGLDASKVHLHRNLGLSAGSVLALVALLAWLGDRRDSEALSTASRAGAVLGALVVGAAAHFGGDMLHPGMAPWSSETHGHGVPGMDSEHVHDAKSGQASGSASADHSAMMGESSEAAPNVQSAPGPTAPGSPAAPFPSASAPPPLAAHAPSHGTIEPKAPASSPSPPAQRAARSPPPASSPARPPSTPAPMDMPPGHEM